MSFDGNYMYGRDVGPFNAATGGNIYRVAMDGTGEMKLTLSGGTHHDLTVTPTGIAYPAKQAAGACDSIYVAGPDGSNSKVLVDLDVVFGKFALGPGAQAHGEVPRQRRSATTRTPTASPFRIARRTPSLSSPARAQVLGSIGATPTGTTPNHAKAEGADSTTSSVWRVQHGHDQYAPNKIVLWSNGSFQGGTSQDPPLHDQRRDGEARLAIHGHRQLAHAQRRAAPAQRQLPGDQQPERRGARDRSRARSWSSRSPTCRGATAATVRRCTDLHPDADPGAEPAAAI